MGGAPVDRLVARRAVEALRAGVPSAAAVTALGTGQADLESRFRAALADADALAGQDRQTPGFLVRGGFGAGKSHLLTVFEHAALAEGFVVSRVVISKETPLHDPAKLLATAVEAMRCGGEVDRGLDPVARRLPDRREEPSLVALGRRLENAADLDDRFAATLTLYLHGFHDQALADRVVRFWAGDKLEVSLIRRALRDLEHPGSHLLQPIKKRDLALQSFAFIPRLVRAAGLPGWVLLIDEVELIGRYSRLQRGRAYAELARWLGALPGEQRPGLAAVGAISDDYESSVLRGGDGRRSADLDDMATYLGGRDPQAAAAAQAGMALIREAALLSAPTQAVLQRTYGTLRELHARAYDWGPPEVTWPEALGTTPMRTFVRAWINAWDVRRLYPGFVEGERPYETLAAPPADYAEDAEPSEPDAHDGDEGSPGADDW